MADIDLLPQELVVEAMPASARARYARMYEEIRRRICLLEFAPGTRLSEEVLAAEFGTSRTPVRRVLARLEDEGLVKSVHGVGTFVTDANIHELQQVYQLRVELVELTGKLNPRKPDASLMAEFHALAERSKKMMQTGNPRAFTQLDMDFFQALMKLTGNRPLREICERLYYRTKRIWIKSALAAEIDLDEEFYIFDREVEDVIAALEIGDLEAVANIQKAHISMSFRRLMSAAENLEDSKATVPQSLDYSTSRENVSSRSS